MLKEYIKVEAHRKQFAEQERLRNKVLMARFEVALIVLGLLGNFFLLRHVMWRPDAWSRFYALSELLTQDKMPDTKYSLVGPLFSIPFWALDQTNQTYWWTTRYNVFVLGAGLLAIYWLLKDRVDHGLLRKFFLLLIVGSMFSHHLLFYYGEVFTAIFVTVGCVAIVVGPVTIGWCAIILGVVNTPATVIGLILLNAKYILTGKRVRYALVIIIGAALIMLESWIRRGGPLINGYVNDQGRRTILPYSGRPGFSYPIFFGLNSLFFSFGKGLLFFAPGLVLPVRQALRKLQEETKVDLFAIYTLWIGFLAGLLLIYACYWNWHGGWFWGPRYLLFASIPASFALAVRLQKRDGSLLMNLVIMLVLCLSIWVGIDGAVYGDEPLRHICTPPRWYGNEMLCYYAPEFSALWFPFVFYQPLSSGQLIYLLYNVFVGLYLLAPLLITTAQQLITTVRQHNWTRLDLRF
ncbi:hypothetical protein [Dictyobacter aurantiacus]|uniref:DUF2029 domain-containing protein n=1 Tax=Dictyobacter aurantiacus TaxID=1936993 RepID=A0A401ZD43_9CHLR|nr:hypothetical protein [Dictyobacter aurantiacus]GCE04804.1 hypothetical protein KDAU_21330 [Dictyobacter aurantiacus]